VELHGARNDDSIGAPHHPDCDRFRAQSSLAGDSARAP
jgi:hypothetical protein